MTHDALAASVPFVSPTLVLPAAPPVIVPAQVFVRLGGLAMTRLAGNGSLKATPLRAVAVLLVIVKVSVEGAPVATTVGLNDLLMVGAPTLVTTVLVLLALLLSSVVLDTIAVLVTLLGAAAATATVTTILARVAPLASGLVLLVQVMAWPAAVHVQPLPMPETNVKPVGSVSVTVNGPLALCGPLLRTARL